MELRAAKNLARLSIVLFFFSLGASAHAQNPGFSLSGRITSATGAAVASAKVAAKSLATGQVSETQNGFGGTLYLFQPGGGRL